MLSRPQVWLLAGTVFVLTALDARVDGLLPTLVVSIVALYGHLLLHELAHGVAARAVGFTLQRVRVGPMVLEWADGTLTVSWSLRGNGRPGGEWPCRASPRGRRGRSGDDARRGGAGAVGHTPSAQWSSPAVVAAVVGLEVLVLELLPGRWLRLGDFKSDGDHLRLSPQLLAAWEAEAARRTAPPRT